MNLNPMAFFLMTSVLISSSHSQVICPSDVTPCECSDRGDGTLNLDCYNRGLSQETASTILQSFLQPGISPLSWLNLVMNGLTAVPPEIVQFSELRELGLNLQTIQMIQPNTFPSSLIYLDLSANELTSIAPGALNGSFSY